AAQQAAALYQCLHDRMTEVVLQQPDQLARLFEQQTPQPLRIIDLIAGGAEELKKANRELRLALALDEIDYLVQAYQDMGRNPTDVELTAFAQATSEHCRHKIFIASWTLDGEDQPRSLFAMIRNAHDRNNK